ncbi:MAG TPA: lamin tail domain-containing protein [Verrucomicrobiales bacterium]|nr:lamin tail domain-containing protein [Verrucomicrobiales bacterium]
MTPTPVKRAPLWLGTAAAVLLTTRAHAAPVINELMYHPLSSLGSPEDPGREWIEIFNPDASAVDISGWQFSKGVGYTFPAGTSIPANGYLVVAAELTKFAADHPAYGGLLRGPWTGTLASGGEKVQLVNAAGATIDDVTYADEGGWATRVRTAASFSHQGWEWEALHDGAGRSLEKIRPSVGDETGQLWRASAANGGTPGAANSTLAAAPVYRILEPRHKPEIPKTTDPVTVKFKVREDNGAPVASVNNWGVWWRTGAGSFQFVNAVVPAVLTDDYVATLGPFSTNNTIVEYYIGWSSAAAGLPTWPAPARTSNPGVQPQTFGQVCNALFLVDNSFDPARDFKVQGNQPILRIIMTAADRTELNQIQTTSGQEDSEATFNCTFISHDGTGTKVVYNSGVRNRGQASALGPPNNFHVSFRSDDKWNGRSSVALNCQYPYSQILGNTIFARAGIATQEAVPVQVRVNGTDTAESGNIMYGRYAMLEGRGADWASRHYPLDPDGNFYRLDDHAYSQGDPRSGEFSWEGPLKASYSDTFIKETNKDADDYSDLIALCRIISAPATGGTVEQPAISDAAYPAALAAVFDIDHFYRYLAVDVLIGNREGGLQSGRADDTSLYRGLLDTRFRFVPHDLDDVFFIGAGIGDPVTRSLFSYDTTSGGLTGLTRVFSHPQLLPKYYAAVLDALNTWYNHATLDPLIDRLFQGWVPAADSNPGSSPNRGISDIKGYIDARRTNVLGQIPQTFSQTVTGTAADSVEGYKVTATGAATFNGNFNVAKTYSVTVNGQLAQWFYRTVGGDNAGTWKLSVPAGGGTVLHPGLNKIITRFWDGINGTGSVIQEFTANVLYNVAGGTTINGALTAPGSVTLLAPASYVPGIPMLVRVDLKDGDGNLNRSAWNTTINLTANNGVTLNPAAVTLFNGMGSALITVGSTTGGGTVNYLSYGTGGGGGAVGATVGTPGSQWRYRTDLTSTSIATIPATWKDPGFDDSTWPQGPGQIGYGDGDDENLRVAVVDYNGAGTGAPVPPANLFRSTFTIADISQLASITGQVKYDDAAVVYINGTEVLRTAGFDTIANVPQVPLTTYSSFGGAATTENATAAITVPLALVHNGVNTIAVQVHQHDNGSSDLTFDLRLQGNLTSTTNDPGNFTLTAAAGSLTANKALTSLGAATGTPVSGTLPAGTTTWSGVVRVTGDVTVPAGATLSIQPGTVVLMTGTPYVQGTASIDTGGADLIVNGELQAAGTLASPISFTCSNPANRWGEINFGNASPSALQFCLLSRSGHSPFRGDHIGGSGGAMMMLNGTTLTIDDSVLADGVGKTLANSGNANITIRRTNIARFTMGPEITGTAFLMEDSNINSMLAANRERGSQDDEDCLYIHNSGGRPVILSRSVLAQCDDDALDLLAGNLTVEDCILRNAFDKGASMLQNNITMRRCLLVDNDVGISSKCQTGADETNPYLTVLENCTIVCENHPTNTGDQSPAPAPQFHSVGVHTRNKYGTTGMNITQQLKNCIISAEEPLRNDYPTVGSTTYPLMSATYTCYQDLGGNNPSDPTVAGTGNLTADPLFTSAAGKDFHLSAGSPCINTGDPAILDPDNSRSDMGALPTGSTGGGAAGEIRWTLAGSPYHLTANTTVPAGVTLRIDPGVNVQCNQNVRFTVNGRILAEGTAANHIVFSHVPGTTAAGDCDPLKNGTQTGAPKWGGLRMVDSLALENVIRYCDFINAQGTGVSGQENWGSVGFVRSWGWVDHCTWAGTHLRMCYGRNSKMTVTHCIFPDMFIFDAALNRIEEPTTDFIAAADNNMEPLKVEYPTTDPEVSGANAANYPNGLPINGLWRVYYNEFHGNRGHQDVFDCDSGRWAPRDASGNQTNGQFVIDCRFNHFNGLAGDEHIDLGGDAYIAGNILEHGNKDFWTNDTGYSNAISSGDKGSGTTIMVARNICYDLDHVINCKANTATIFEHNTVANMHADFNYVGSTVTQNVVCAPVNFFIPNDGAQPTYGDGAYMGYNIVSNVNHVFSGPDARRAVANGPVVNDITTKIEFSHNLLDQITDPAIGPNHPGGFFSGTYGPNEAGAPGFVDAANEDYSLRMDSLARQTAPGGFSYGAAIPEWAYVIGGPSGTVANTSAGFTVGGPGIVAYKWRLDDGAWSASIQIGDGGVLPRDTPTIRQATLNLTNLTAGAHTLEVLGQDMAGNWQDADPARILEGLPQATPTTRTWIVNTALPLVALHEVYGDPNPQTPAAPQQLVEIISHSATPIDLTGWSLSDGSTTPGEQPLSGTLAPGATAEFALVNFKIANGGDEVYLFDSSNTLRDSIVFGPFPAGYSLARVGSPAAWTLATPTLGGGPAAATNIAARTGDPSSVRINEWLSASGIRFNDDWVELANLSAFPVSLTGLVLTDSRFGEHHAFPALSYIGGSGFLKLIADGNPSAGANHTSFRLDDVTEEILLLTATGAEQDYVRYFPQIEDVSQGLVTSGGTGGYNFFPLGTGGFVNGTSDPGYSNALAILNGLRITEIMYNPAGGGNFEFIELTNTGAVPLDLGGVVFYDGIDFTFPAGFTLAAGAQTVLVNDLPSFQSRYGSSLNVAGEYTGALDNNGEELALRLANPWDANVLRFRYESTWYDTNGTGLSLILASNSTDIHDFDSKSSWATGPNGGSPAGGTVQGNDLASWLTAHGLTSADLLLDGDGDSLTNLVEYALSTDPAVPAGGNGVLAAPVSQFSTLSGNTVPALLVAIPASALPGGFGVNGVTYFLQDSADFSTWRDVLRKSPTDAAWQNLTGALPLVETLGNSGGKAQFVLKSPDSISTGIRRYLRLKIVQTP